MNLKTLRKSCSGLNVENIFKKGMVETYIKETINPQNDITKYAQECSIIVIMGSISYKVKNSTIAISIFLKNSKKRNFCNKKN